MIARFSIAAGALVLAAAPALAGGFTPAVAPVAPAPIIAPAPVTPVSTGSTARWCARP